MKALNLYGRQDVRYQDIPAPEIEHADDVLIKVKVAGICGSDISRFGKIGPYKPGMTWGHEFSGVVAEIGANVTSLRVGDPVTACNCFPCFICPACQQGAYAQCAELKVLGGQYNGAFAEFIRVPARNVVTLPVGMDFDTACFIEPTSVAIRGLNHLDIKVGDSVAIVGCGTIGLLALQLARLSGARQIIALDTTDQKLTVAAQTGATTTLNVTQAAYLEQFTAETGGTGVDIVIESSGNAAGISGAMALARKGGTVLLLGIPYGDVAFPRGNFENIIRNELKVLGSWNSISAPFPGREWETAINCLCDEKIDVSPLISQRVPLEDVPALLPQLYQREVFFVKTLIDIPQ